jgi:cell division protein YceG involved in septum cleavage
MLRAGEPPPDDSVAPSLEELPEEGEPAAEEPGGIEETTSPPADALSGDEEPSVYAPAVQETTPAGADAPSSHDATVDPASDRALQTPSASHEPIVPAPKERPYSEVPAYAPLATPQPAGADEQPPVSAPAPPLPPPASRTPAPEGSVPPPRSRRSRSPIARVAAVFALAAVVAALLLLFHSLRSKPAVKVAVPTVVKVVIPEGKTRPQIAQIASAAGLIGSYRAASRHSPLLNPAHYGAPHGTSTLEGFLFPATYDMDSGASVGRLAQEQLIAFRENFGAQEFARARSLHITPYELLIVASMVEREAQVPGDRAKIAAVIYNRLREGMPLGIDATIYYAVELAKGIATYTHELSEAQLHIDSPYNTRTHAGLPPTPISNPGLASIHAAAHPAHVSYLYYVAGADGCGEQVFSNTLAEFEVHSAAYKAAVQKNGGHPPSCKHTLTGTGK